MKFLLSFFILSACIDMINSEASNPSSGAGDRLSLLSFKSLISYDSSGALVSWNDSLPFCQWHGVTCGNRHPMRVTALDLDSLGLAGSMSPSLGSLTFLRRLDISSNRLHGRIPWELGQLFRLQRLNLSFNDLEGGIPEALSRCSYLQSISLRDNHLQGGIPSNISNCHRLQLISISNNMLGGGIPAELGSLPKLEGLIVANNTLTGGIPDSLGNLTSLVVLDLKRNSLTGNIPPSLSNLSSLSYLSLAINALTGGIPSSLGRISSLTVLQLPANTLSGRIPPALGDLSSLTALTLSHNNLSGTIPSSLYNVSSIIYFDVADNNLFGALPRDLGLQLPNLQGLHMYSNQFDGPIPASLTNASELEDLSLSDNNFSGVIPANMGALQSLTWLMLDRNQLRADGWIFASSLTNCSRLRILQLHENKLGGRLPSSLANLSTQMEWLSLESNGISGSIPAEIGKLINLATIYMDSNLLTGSIPFSIGSLRRLQTLSLSGNFISGEIPSSISNLTQLNRLLLSGNALRGGIPTSLGNCSMLELIDLSYNNITGFIPREVVSISSLSVYFDVSYNSLIGPLPVEVGSLTNLEEFDVSGNQLSGEIPSSLGGCQHMEILHLDENSIRGTIPPSLGNLKGVQELDLSRNNLSGNIPGFLGGFLSLTYLNLSFNNFEGEVPKMGVFRNVSAVSVIGNNKLCGGDPGLHLPPCPVKAMGQKHKFRMLKVIAPVVAAVFCFIVVTLLCIMHRRMRKSWKISRPSPSPKDRYAMFSYAELLKATDGFSSTKLIGVGSFGSVYKGVMDDDDDGNEKAFAVKVLNLQQRGASKSFVAECEALRNVRHRNLMKILSACSSVDFRGNDFKALVFEFMPNGSLENWLHPPESNGSISVRYLDFIQRLSIAIDVASALEYLHRNCYTTIVHCDLKPSNILLDDDMTALVGDFGLARLLSEPASQSSVTATSSIVLRGSIGYVAPEYGMGGAASTQGDVYSYGILLLEMFTGKRPTDDFFEGGLSLHKFAAAAFPVRVMDVVDPRLLSDEDEMACNEARGRMLECLLLVIGVGLSCSKESPRERIRMEDAVKEMCVARGTFLGVRT